MRKKIGLWLLAARPKTLVASIIPVSLGVSLAYEQSENISFDLIVMCFLFSILVQIATNFANDFFDSLTGADSERTLGPKRFSDQGFIKGVHLRNVSYILLLFAFALGVIIMEISGANRWLLFVGLASVLCALAYTGGPFPFAYNGLGDVFVILFFGFVAVTTTHYVLVTDTGGIWKPNWIVPLGVGFIINNLLVVNNYRDRITDKKVRKNTIIVLLGKRFGIALYFCGFLIPSVCCPLLDNRFNLAVILFPVGFFLVYKLNRAKTKTDFSFLLTCSSISVLIYGCIIAGAIMIKQ